ncbi:MAG TPA: hypothetical protein VJ761_21970 [Ktedonobacteraceae bacterium]|nr:hypothetical protein [Ktedonobacteraceae bacterium]
MSFFHQVLIDQLYLAEEGNGTRGSLALVLPGPAEETEIDLETALHSEQLAGIFVFAARALEFASADRARTFVETILAHTARRRAMIWVLDPARITHETAPFLELAPDGQRTTTGLLADLTPTLQFVVQSGIKLTLASPTSTVVDIGEGTSTIQMEFAGPAKPVASLVTTGQLPVAGSWRGCFQFHIFLQRQSLSQQLNWGFQFLFPGAQRAQEVLSEWLPLASAADPGAGDMLGFQVTLDPCDVYNEVFDPCAQPDVPCDQVQAYHSRRTFFTFTGSNSTAEATTLASYYRTIYGQAIRLWPVGDAAGGGALLPARLVLTRGEETRAGAQAFQLAPEGDFELEVQGVPAGTRYELLCGLHGDEFLRFASRTSTTRGEFLRFLSRQPAFAPGYPFERVSPIGPPVDPTASLLTHRYLTSWLTLISDPASGLLPYVAQPQGSALFGKEGLIQASAPTLLGHVTPGGPYPGDATTVFPLPPYAGAHPGDGQTSFSGEQISLFEREVIAPTRRRIIGAMVSRLQGLATAAPVLRGAVDTSQDFTTPSGLIATLTCNEQGACRWSTLLLGQNMRPQPRRMLFAEPGEQLVQAFQTNQLFLVVGNATHLGQLVGDGPASGRAFWNQMHIEDWLLEAQVGQQNHYADYRDILIFKGRRGKLYDPQGSNDENLVANPAQWTQSAAFAAPTTVEQPDLPDQKQLVILSQWLQDFFRNASQQSESVFYEHFNRIATDENWTGLLILNMHVKQIPDALTGLISGIKAPEAFCAHHFAIEINQVKITQQGIGLEDSSSMFGLISYLDPACDPAQPDQPVPSTTGAPYDFRLLRLQVLFENTAIKQFRSTAQLTLNELFQTPVDHMGEGGNPYNALMLHGSYQQNDGQGLYSLSSIGSRTFYLQQNLLKKVEISSAQMSTRDPGEQNAVISWFTLGGFLDFALLQQTSREGEKIPFDVFSFGNQDEKDLPRQGLSFSNLGIQLTYPLDQEQPQQEFAFSTGEMAFDLTTSTPRPASLFVNLGLQVQGIVSGDEDTTPAKAGYLPVIPDLRLSGVEGSPWYGLRFRLHMGTPGELAGKVSLNSYLLAAWSPTSNEENTYRALVGLELPGTGGGAQLISLQTVLKLSIGQIRLTYLQEQQSFLLLFSEIALRFLGLLKIPPGGNTIFYLFGNPQSEGESAGLGWYTLYRKSSVVNILERTGREKELLS